MKEYSALRVGGMGDLVVVKSEEELKDAVEYAAAGGRRISCQKDSKFLVRIVDVNASIVQNN